MKAEELMIGDWVHYRGANIQITSLYDKGGSNEIGWSNKESVWVNGCNVEPIPLTVEILEKNGFEVDEKDENMLKWRWSVIDDCMSYDKSTGKLRIFYVSGLVFVKMLEFVHELQHALRLCEIDKEIVL